MAEVKKSSVKRSSDKVPAGLITMQQVMWVISELAKVGQLASGGLWVPGVSSLELRLFLLIEKMFRDLNLHSRYEAQFDHDPMGNFTLTMHGRQRSKPAIVLITHLDTVRSGGWFDGRLMAALMVCIADAINRGNIHLDRNLVFVFVRCEEATRFGEGSLFSKHKTGRRDTSAILGKIVTAFGDEDLGSTIGNLLSKEWIDPDTGAFVPDGETKPKVKARKRNLDHAPMAEIKDIGGQWARCIEFHIDQSRALARGRYPIAIAPGLAAPNRWKTVLRGRSGHAGAEPMGEGAGSEFRRTRADATWLMAQCVCAFHEVSEEYSKDSSTHRVNLVSDRDVSAGGTEQIQGRYFLNYEIRDTDPARRQELNDAIQERFQNVVLEFNKKLLDEDGLGVSFDTDPTAFGDPVKCDPASISAMVRVCTELKVPYRKNLLCGAWHDIGNAALSGVPSVVGLVRCFGGSHNPEEEVTQEDALIAAEVLLYLVLGSDQELSAAA